MANRKRTRFNDILSEKPPPPSKKAKISSATKSTSSRAATTIQVVTGSYDRVLHGITATISADDDVQFADTFLFNAHTSAIRSLALSPPSTPTQNQTQKIILATGSTDERVNLYHLSAHTPTKISIPAIPSLTSKAVVENPQNRELGCLLHHSSAITKLYFPNRGKLMSSAEDNTIAITRTRDWNMLSTIKAPMPTPVGRPSGDTAPTGGSPIGVNDFAVHPSMKLMITVGKGEKSMRLWNLVTGKRAGVLNFERGLLLEVREGRYSSGEGRKVAWGADGAGDEEFCVVFERGALVFGMDSKPKCRVLPQPRTKLHQLAYIQLSEQDEGAQILALSTENGRILFYSTRPRDLVTPVAEVEGGSVPQAMLIAELACDVGSIAGRIKDFSVLPITAGSSREFIIPTASSGGAVRLWRVAADDLIPGQGGTKRVGTLLGTYETRNRLTCLASFVMLPAIDGAGDDQIKGEPDITDEAEDSSTGSE